MKKLISLILCLLLCFTFIVSCENEEEPTSSSSSSSSSSASESLLTGITKDSFDSYTTYTDEYSFVLPKSIASVAIKPITSYDMFLQLTERLCVTEKITKQTFEDNFVLLINGDRGLNEKDIYYSDLKKIGDGYILTYSVICKKEQVSDKVPYSDVCVISRDLCSENPLDIKIKLKQDNYTFLEEIYKSECALTSSTLTPYMPLLYVETERVILDNITREYFDNYVAYTDTYRFTVGNEAPYAIKTVTSYAELLEISPSLAEIGGLNDSVFEDNFVVLINGIEGHIRIEDIYYTDFKREGDHYNLTYNLVLGDELVSPQEDPFSDVCIIPKELCDQAPSKIEIRIVKRYYAFSAEAYASSCEVITRSFR